MSGISLCLPLLYLMRARCKNSSRASRSWYADDAVAQVWSSLAELNFKVDSFCDLAECADGKGPSEIVEGWAFPGGCSMRKEHGRAVKRHDRITKVCCFEPVAYVQGEGVILYMSARGRMKKKAPYLGSAAADAMVVILPALGIGILLGSMGAARGQSLFGTSLLVPLARIVCVVASAACAVLFRNSTVKKPILLGAAAALVLVQLGAALLTLVFGESERFALGIIATVAEGTSLALIMFLFLSSLLDRSPKEIAVAVSLGFVLLNVYDCFFIGASDEACTIQWLVGKMGALAIAGSIVAQGRSRAAIGAMGDEEGGGPSSVERRQAGEGPSDSGQPACRFPFSTIAPFASLVTVLFLVQGTYSHITGVGGVGSNALFDMTVGIYVVGVRILVFGFCLVAKKELTPVSVAATGSLLWIFGLLLTTLLWNADIRFMGALALNSGLYIMQPLVLILAVQLARRKSGQAVPILFSMVALEYTNHITRLLTLFFVADPSGIRFEDLALASVVSLAIVAAASISFLLVSRRSAEDAATSSPKWGIDRANPLVEAELSSPLLRKEIEQFRRFKRLSQDKHLTQREEEVLYEAMHGYSIDHIAERLCLSRQTGETYLSRSYGRLGVNSKQEALKLLDTYNAT